VGLGGEAFSGLTVRTATAAGRRAGSVARLALSLSLGAASSSSLILLAADSRSGRLAAMESSESRRQTESRLLIAEDDDEDDDLGWHSSSLATCCSSSASLGLDSRVRALLDAWRSLMPLATCRIFQIFPPLVPPPLRDHLTSTSAELKFQRASISSVRLARRFLVSSDSALRRSLMSSLAEELVEEDAGLSLGGGGKLESSSITGGATGLDTADPPPSTPLLTDGVFSESLHSSSSPESKVRAFQLIETAELNEKIGRSSFSVGSWYFRVPPIEGTSKVMLQ